MSKMRKMSKVGTVQVSVSFALARSRAVFSGEISNPKLIYIRIVNQQSETHLHSVVYV